MPMGASIMGAVTMKVSDCQLLVSLLSPTWPQLSAPTHTVCCPTLRPAVVKPPPKFCDTPAASELVML